MMTVTPHLGNLIMKLPEEISDTLDAYTYRCIGLHISHAEKHYVSAVYFVHQCYLAVVRPCVGWVEACIYLSMDKSL